MLLACFNKLYLLQMCQGYLLGWADLGADGGFLDLNGLAANNATSEPVRQLPNGMRHMLSSREPNGGTARCIEMRENGRWAGNLGSFSSTG